MLLLVKGEDDFGRESIGNGIAKFDVVGYQKPMPGTEILIIYPQKATFLLYNVIGLTKSYEGNIDDGPFIYNGTMKHNDVIKDLNEIIDRLSAQHISRIRGLNIKN